MGQARNRGIFEERKERAIKEGRVKRVYRRPSRFGILDLMGAMMRGMHRSKKQKVVVV